MSVDALLPNDEPSPEAYRAHIRELEARLEESEETLAAIRRGDFDAVVVEGPNHERLVYTLENADRPYRVLIEQIQEGAFTLGLDGTLLYCNRRLADMLGEPQERLVGRSLHSFVRGDTDLDGLVRTAMTSPVREEIELVAAEGAERATFLSLSRLEQQVDDPLLCGILTDLTEQRRSMQALAEAHARLQLESVERERVEEALRQSQKLEAVGQLTGGVAHDFNNLLTVIKSSTDLLKRPDLPEERRRRYVEAISDTVDRAAKLTGQLLAFARRQALRPEVFDIGQSLRAVAEMLDSVTGARITVDARIPDEPCYIRADLSQFETALINMAVNARDAMGGEGTLTLRLLGGRPMPAIRGHAGSRCTFAAVSLADTGIGIAPEVLPRIFEPFFTTKEIGKGTGSDCRRSSASPSNRGATSMWRASPASARPSRSTCRRSRRPLRQPTRALATSAISTAPNCASSWSRTISTSAGSPRRSSRIWATTPSGRRTRRRRWRRSRRSRSASTRCSPTW